MSVRQILNATYAFFVAHLGQPKVEEMLGAVTPSDGEKTPAEDARVAQEQRQAISTLSELARLPRAGARA